MDNITDYQNFTTRSTPKDKRRKMNIGDIWSNTIKCTNCGDKIRSRNRHDMVFCSCGKTAIDGGSWYSKITGDTFELYIEPYDDAKENS